MSITPLQRALIVYFRLAMGWTFLYAGVSQLLDPSFTAASFLGTTKTFHDFFAWFAQPAIIPYTNFLVEWGHTLIGLSLIAGLLVRVSGSFGCLLLLTYYFAHMDFPYVESKVNFIMEYHLVYIGVLIWLIAVRAGEVCGLDGLAERLSERRAPWLASLIGKPAH